MIGCWSLCPKTITPQAWVPQICLDRCNYVSQVPQVGFKSAWNVGLFINNLFFLGKSAPYKKSIIVIKK